MLKKQIAENEIIEYSREAARILEEKKAEDVLIMDLKRINSYLDYFIIATGNSHIHCAGLAKDVQRYFKTIDFREVNRPRLDTGWIALDYNEIVIHIFTRELRDYYQLERLWGDAEFIRY